MAVAVSSLSIAVQGIADFLDAQFGEDVILSIDSPQRAAERVKGGDKHFLNLFVYRVLPSGFQASSTAGEPFFVRIHALLTPFLTDQGGGASDIDLRILGHAIRILASRPVLPGAPLPGQSSDPGDFRSGPHLDYRLQAVLLAPSMEELNHIWTTQGGDLAYRLSAAYEFALIPIEPLEHSVEAPPVVGSILDLQPSVPAIPPDFVPYGPEVHAFPLAATLPEPAPPPTNFLPVVLFSLAGGLSNRASVAPGTDGIPLAISGPRGAKVAVTVEWTRESGDRESQAPQSFAIGAQRIDDPDAVVTLALDDGVAGDSAVILTRAADDAGTAIPNSPFANTRALSVEGA